MSKCLWNGALSVVIVAAYKDGQRLQCKGTKELIAVGEGIEWKEVAWWQLGKDKSKAK